MGAWIEIHLLLLADRAFLVAPLVGAWIEIVVPYVQFKWLLVAPLVGAWIEIMTIIFFPPS